MTVCKPQEYFVYFKDCKLAAVEKDPAWTKKIFQKAEQIEGG